MPRLTRTLSAASLGLAGVLIAAPAASAEKAGVSAPQGQQARLASGTITGTVIDESGAALAGAMVSALGATLASTVTDEDGRFTLGQLPPGQYFLRAHLIGFGTPRGEFVQVGPSPAVHRFELRRLPAAAVGTAGEADGALLRTRPIIAAGFDLPLGPEPATEVEESADRDAHPHTETAWRLRHIKRSVLKDATPVVVLNGETDLTDGSVIGRAVGSAAGLASAVFTELPFSGEVNFLTTGAVAPGDVLSATAFPRGVAYLALAAPGAGGDWSIRAAMSEGDLSSWIVAGAFASNPGGAHTYDFGLSYSTQEYFGGNPAALAAVGEGSRNVGELYAYDRWAIRKAVALDVGARYAHHDYLEKRALLSPQVGLTLEPFGGVRVRANAAQRMLAPGAEEFLSTRASGPSLPPERTFAPLGAPGEAFRVERARTYDVVLEKDVGAAYVIAISRFHQSVDDQLATLFGMHAQGVPGTIGHYYVGSAGAFDADGWALRLDTPPTGRIQGSVHYRVTRARWAGRGDQAALAAIAPAAIRPDTEDLHDLTSSLQAEIPETATRVFVLYKLNSGFVRANTALERPGLDGRFEVQINQAIPLTFAGTRWEVLLGLRNLFRDPADAASVYDELLVVKPPMRLVGGFLVRF